MGGWGDVASWGQSETDGPEKPRGQIKWKKEKFSEGGGRWRWGRGVRRRATPDPRGAPPHLDSAPDLDRPPPQGGSRPPPPPRPQRRSPPPRPPRLPGPLMLCQPRHLLRAGRRLPPGAPGPAARTVRGAQPAQGLQGQGGAARHPGRSSEAKGRKREKKGEKVCHRLEGGGKCKTRQEMRLKKMQKVRKEIRKRGRGGAWVPPG